MSSLKPMLGFLNKAMFTKINLDGMKNFLKNLDIMMHIYYFHVNINRNCWLLQDITHFSVQFCDLLFIWYTFKYTKYWLQYISSDSIKCLVFLEWIGQQEKTANIMISENIPNNKLCDIRATFKQQTPTQNNLTANILIYEKHPMFLDSRKIFKQQTSYQNNI